MVSVKIYVSARQLHSSYAAADRSHMQHETHRAAMHLLISCQIIHAGKIEEVQKHQISSHNPHGIVSLPNAVLSLCRHYSCPCLLQRLHLDAWPLEHIIDAILLHPGFILLAFQIIIVLVLVLEAGL